MDSSSTLPMGTIIQISEDGSKTYDSSRSQSECGICSYKTGSLREDLSLCSTASEQFRHDLVDTQYSFQPENMLFYGNPLESGMDDQFNEYFTTLFDQTDYDGFNQILPLNDNAFNDPLALTRSLELGRTDFEPTEYPGCVDGHTLLPTQCQQIVEPQTGCLYDALNNANSSLPATNHQSTTSLLSEPDIIIQSNLDPATLIPTLPLSTPIRPPDILPRQNQSLQALPESAPSPANPDGTQIKIKRRRRRKPPPPPEVAAAKRQAFLLRNREAAAKCRVKKRTLTSQLEDEERAARQQNRMMKELYKDMRKEVFCLVQQVKEIGCQEDCEGCGEYAPMRKDSVAGLSDCDTFHEPEEEGAKDMVTDDDDDDEH